MVEIVVAAVALNVELVVPAAMVTVDGSVNSGLLLVNETGIPPAGAAVFSVAEQVEIWPPFRLPGAHVIEESTGTETRPPDVVNAGSAEPFAATPTGFDMPTDIVVALAAKVSWMLATTPVASAFVFDPLSRQVSEPGVEAQEGVFPAAVAAALAITPITEI